MAGALALLAWSSGCGGEDVAPRARDAGLAIGVTEANPNLVWSPQARLAPPPFQRWQRALHSLRPSYYRVMVDWEKVQPAADVPPNWDLVDPGCMRATPPCAPYAGVREQLRAARSRQRGDGALEVLVVFWGMPAWAGKRAPGCRSERAPTRALAVAPRALPAYGELVRSLLELAIAEGVTLRWWSPWNEPNLEAHLAPQRSRCDRGAASRAPAAYARLARTLAAELARAPGEQRIVLGELAGFTKPEVRAASVAEFVAALPDEVICAGAVFSQHAYVYRPEPGEAASARRSQGSVELLSSLIAALDRRRCEERKRIWITETGLRRTVAGAAADEQAERAGCRALHATLAAWDRHPRIDAAFQYSFREHWTVLHAYSA